MGENSKQANRIPKFLRQTTAIVEDGLTPKSA
jgi:hypothetical protein